MRPTALIAEDEPLLAAALQAELAHAWPELQVLAVVGDGHSAVAKTLELQPDVLFFDVQMPGQSGLEAALQLADDWPDAAGTLGKAKAFPALVLVTAYDQYAVQAFEAQAVDYILKPVNHFRLSKTVEKIQSGLIKTTREASEFESILEKLRLISGSKSTSNESSEYNSIGNLKQSAARLSLIQASVGSTLHMVHINDVAYFEAADKYVRVLAKTENTSQVVYREYLIRTPLKELLPQLDPALFWQVHRGTVVRAECIEQVNRDEAGKLWLSLRGLTVKISVSRLFSHQFKAM